MASTRNLFDHRMDFLIQLMIPEAEHSVADVV
jgi:hypothetical protein